MIKLFFSFLMLNNAWSAAGIFKNGKIYWGGGGTDIDEPWIGANVFTCQVEILDLNSQAITFANLSSPFAWFYGYGVFEKDDKIGFLNHDYATSLYYIDIYNTTTNAWSIAVLNPAYAATGASRIISAGNDVFIISVGQLWKLEF